MALTVPEPTLKQEGAAGARFAMAKPIEAVCGPVSFPDGSLLTVESMIEAGFMLMRELPMGVTSAWDEQGRGWVPLASPPQPQPLMYAEPRWKTTIVAVGQQDAAGAEKFAAAGAGYPFYSLACSFRGHDAAGVEHEGHSARSAAIELVAPGEDDRVGVAITPEKPPEALEVRLFLKDAGLVERGSVGIRSTAAGFAVELRTDAATVTLDPSGDIALRPAQGRSVLVEQGLAVSGPITVNGVQLNVP
jgi:hypothetical protein